MSRYEEMIKSEYERAWKTPLSTRSTWTHVPVSLFRADLLNAGVKRAIGRCLVANAVDKGMINCTTKAIVVHGAGNTVTAVKAAVKELHLGIVVVAVVYAETNNQVRQRLRTIGVEVIAETPRAGGREGRDDTADKICAERDGYVLLEQHEEPLIVDIQRRTFGRRIANEWRWTDDIILPTHFIAGVGTGGTLFGIGSALREINPTIQLIAVEGAGSTLSLWHAYLEAKRNTLAFAGQKRAIERALQAYRKAGMLTRLSCHPDASPEEWFEISIEFPEDTTGVVGIEGLGVGDPTELIKENLRMVSRVKIVTDDRASRGMRMLAQYGIHAVASAGANFFTMMEIAKELHRRKETGHIVTVVTAKRL